MDKPSKLAKLKLVLEYDRTLRDVKTMIRKRTIKK